MASISSSALWSLSCARGVLPCALWPALCLTYPSSARCGSFRPLPPRDAGSLHVGVNLFLLVRGVF
eukprot:7298810-Pyramimonas_sp.AAC.1